MTREEVYDIWRPTWSPWSRWVKPVLFSFLPQGEIPSPPRLPAIPPWDVPSVRDTALIVDLPGNDGAFAGIALAVAGYRPIPIYNACLAPAEEPAADQILTFGTSKSRQVSALVDVEPILQALVETAHMLARADLPSSSPPAFLVDAGRKGRRRPKEGWFDNRSFVNSSDFPSANLLHQHGIFRVVVVTRRRTLEPDLLEVCLAWQKQGLQFAFQKPWELWSPRPRRIKKPAFLKRAVGFVFRRLAYPRRTDGAFGQIVRRSGHG